MNKTCADCIHYDVCREWNAKFIDERLKMGAGCVCKDFKDKSRFIELPCAVGDTVYCINSFFVGNTSRRKKAIKPKVVDFVFTTPFMAESEGMILKERDFGKTVFLTKEDAEKALKGEAK